MGSPPSARVPLVLPFPLIRDDLEDARDRNVPRPDRELPAALISCLALSLLCRMGQE
jgi:hypothetical protein